MAKRNSQAVEDAMTVKGDLPKKSLQRGYLNIKQDLRVQVDDGPPHLWVHVPHDVRKSILKFHHLTCFDRSEDKGRQFNIWQD